MIIFQRTASIAPGKAGPAIAFAHEIAKTFKAMTSLDLTVMMPVGGNPNRVAWRASYKDLAQMDEMTMKMMSDKNYMSQVASAADLFIPGSVNDEIWRTV